VAIPEDDNGESCKDHISCSVEYTGDVNQRHGRFVRDAFPLECVDEQVGWVSTAKSDEEDEHGTIKGVESSRNVYQASLPFYYHDPEEEDCQTDLEEYCGEDVESIVYDDEL